MQYKDLLVTIHASETGEQQTKLALGLARQHDANLLGYYVSPTVGEFPVAPTYSKISDLEPRSADGGRSVSAAALAEAIQTRFEADLKTNDLKGAWVLSGDNLVQDIVAHIRAVDLAIIGLGDPDRMDPDPQGFRPEEVILACGRPVLGVPVANVPAEVGRKVLVAWDGSRGATRAMHDALPLLKRADSVTLLAVDPPTPDPAPVKTAAEHLRRHGIEASERTISSEGLAVGDAILAECDYLSSDLVVAGAYGHPRLSESILGGVSRTLLRQMMVPVLMSH
jgi:nucleotide-binding universal stress UspA family protein